MRRRRTVREFSDRDVDRRIIEDCLRAAGTAPSGANQQPWQFVAVSDPSLKKQIRDAAEKVERDFYQKESTAVWRNELKKLKTNPSKPFLETAPYLIVIFAERFGFKKNGGKKKHYYVSESVGIATGILITALHQTGLVSLTYTPANMQFLNRILSRPENEKPFLILVVGYPSDVACVPALTKKSLKEISKFI
jgi:nitroreductase